jgi:hypothetical protein
MRKHIIICLCFCTGFFAVAQNDSVPAPVLKTRRLVLITSSAALTATSLFYLNKAWYSDYNTGAFHYFNDNGEWLQMDKAGHVYSTYQTGRLMMEAFDWAGFGSKKVLLAGTTGILYLGAIEVMDGYSRGWGFSWGDMAANALGAALCMTQEAWWKEQKVALKFSYARSGLAAYNPRLLGNTFATRLLKDYNAQIYWLSFNPMRSFFSRSSFPRWLNLAIGYSAYGMLGGHQNNVMAQDVNGKVLQFERRRQFLISIDIDCSRIRTRSPALRALFSVINMIKIPAPALLVDKRGVYFNVL